MLIRAIVFVLLATPLLHGQPKHIKRLNAAADVLREIMAVPDNSIPQDLLDRAECVVVIPGAKKGAFIFGGKYGRGYFACRNENGVGWSRLGAVRIEGFSFGLQAGGSETDFVLLIMNERGMRRLLTSRFTLGGDASVAGGPVGRTVTAQTDALMTAEILSYSRSRGVFAGLALDGATLRQDPGVNKRLYGKPTTNRSIFMEGIAPPDVSQPLISLLNKHSARKGR
jgi:lipid-binding SYLF domain-containing protein